MKIVENAKIACKVWNELNTETQQNISIEFHLRPTNSGITIVSILPAMPMRGLTVTSEAALKEKLILIYKRLNEIKQGDQNTIQRIMTELNFKLRKHGASINEENIQAMMINQMGADENLKKLLNATDRIQFVASELITERGNHRVDIVGFDGNDLYFFELKKARTMKVNQVVDYVNFYSNSETFKELMTNYPINSVNKFNAIKGIMVMKSDENSWNKLPWQEAEDGHKIRILFYDKHNKHLSFTGVKKKQ